MPPAQTAKAAFQPAQMAMSGVRIWEKVAPTFTAM